MESFGTIFEKNQMDNNFSWLFIYANSYKTAKNLTTKPITPLGKKRGRKKTYSILQKNPNAIVYFSLTRG